VPTNRLVAASHLTLAILLAFAVWVALPARWLPVDIAGTALAAACGAAALALFARRAWAPRLARVVSWVLLVSGCTLTTLLAMSFAHLYGSYGPVGGGGALLMTCVALLFLPYLVGVPAWQLARLRGQ
jgi:hypothetical protein